MDRSPSGSDRYRIHRYERVSSTNEVARALAIEGAPAWTAVVADEQMKGRGRHGRSWHSPRGNLYLSIVVRPNVPPARGAQIGFVAAVALAEAVEALTSGSIAPSLKWPNDVLIGDAKVAGILAESGGGAAMDWIVVGSGVNVASAPDGTAYPAACLVDHGWGARPLDALLDGYLERLADGYDRWIEDGFAPVRTAWIRRAKGVGSEIAVTVGAADIRGRFVDLDGDGALVLDQLDGGRRRVTAGEIYDFGA